jgi:UDP-N-acetylglucosamine diphosphorylase/glucosamine-1-phosphate N-acetyltransferase
LYDDPQDVTRFQPFTQSRPVGELRYGAWLLRERVAHTIGPVAGYLSRTPIERFVDVDAPPVVAAPRADQACIVLRSSFAPAGRLPAGLTGTPGLRLTDAAGVTVGALVAGRDWHGPDGIDPSWSSAAIEGRWLEGAWQLVDNLPELLRADLAAITAERGPARIPAGCTVLGDPSDVLIDEGAAVEPLVVLDTRGGPIWIRAGAEVRALSRLAGPLVVGERTRVVGGQLRESSIGPVCIVHGEVSNSVWLGFANKSHDGFLGHSVVGRWANLGAGTITSNLKNTYGPVRLDLGAERIETGQTFLGSLIGDHVKTAIGTMLPTGCVVGTGANVFGTARPGATVPPFAWGTDEAGRVMACRMFLQTASRVLPRRAVAWDDAQRDYLTAVWEAATGQRCD